ncbi:MAG TPA: outer membrane protein assembly factor BamE [Spongiibacteraceae bacterium]|nr:outer membrane protein assembly factor BamE [Spongiibacteraceae bacterium]HUH36808.1 outer membrane protein assembly factor BamE [Spongiibacteraceae bacterium]
MQKLLPLILAVAVSACSNLDFPGVYRLTIDQGNIITQEMVDQLQPGMSKSQVQFIMGTALVQDTFHADRWDYVYTIAPGGRDRQVQRLSLFFESDKLAHLSGDFVPSGTQTPDDAR